LFAQPLALESRIWNSFRIQDQFLNLRLSLYVKLIFSNREPGKFQHSVNKIELYVIEQPALALREERRLRLFESRVLRNLFSHKRDEVTGEWRKLHNEELNDLYSTPNIVRVIKSRRMRWTGHVARIAERRGVYRV